MDEELHSAAWALVDESGLSVHIKNALSEIRQAFPGQSIEARRWNKNFVAVTLAVSVELPGRGPVGGVDIRASEPIIVLFNEERYPYVAPTIRSNRKDFPKTKFPHINPTSPGQPAYFCLHRGSIDAWFAEHTVIDLIHRARGWFRDAARDRLVPDEDEFERTLVTATRGTFIYDPEYFLSEVNDNWKFNEGKFGFLFVGYDLLDDEKMAEVGQTGFVVRAESTVTPATYEISLKLAGLLNEAAKIPKFKGEYQQRLFGILLFCDAIAICDEHFGELPDTLGGFIDWAEALGMPARVAFDEYLGGNFHLFAGIPITITVRRPKNLIGTNSPIELINFLVSAGGDHWPKESRWDLNAKVSVADHRTPLTPKFARYVSSLQKDSEIGRSLVLGCGALGSKITMHFARSGHVNYKLIDYSLLAPHNLVRHALGGEQIGISKAEGLKNAIVKLYPGIEALPVTGEHISAFDFLVGSRKSELGEYDHILDATASTSVFNALCDVELPPNAKVYRTEIADGGAIGLLSVEGAGRNPRLDDLQAMLFDKAIDDPLLSRWLVSVQRTREHEVGSGLEEIQIGLSCSSATMRLADEVVSHHAAGIARRLRNATSPERVNDKGFLYRTSFYEDMEGQASTFECDPVTIIKAQNDSTWELRIASHVKREMYKRLHRASPRETGGVLIGMINQKRRIVYITRIVDAPLDSKGTPVVFVRGTYQLPETIQKIEQKTGGLLGYVGEWHTHPMGGSDLSETDELAVAELRTILDPVSLPTLVTIVTPTGIHPHFFEAGKTPIYWPPPPPRTMLEYLVGRLAKKRRPRR